MRSLRTICAIGCFMALLGANAAPVAAIPPKLQLEAFLFPDNVLTDSQDRTIAFCLLNHGQANELVRQGEDDDRLILTIPRGEADADLAAPASVPACTPSDPLWDCTVDAASPDEVVLTLGPPLGGSVAVETSQTICFSIAGVNVNSTQGLSFLELEQFIDSRRAQGLEERPLAVFKSMRGVVLHDDLEGVESHQHHAQTWEMSGDDIYSISSGDVGIGTSDPRHRLHVAASPGELAGFFEGSGMFTENFGIGTTPLHRLHVAAAAGELAGVFEGGGMFTENFGIGTTPLHRLHVQAPAGGFAGYFEGKGYFRSNLGIGTDDPQHLLHVQARPGYFAGYFDGMGYFSKNVGIGTANPQHPLHVWAPKGVFAGYFQGKGYFRNNLGIGTANPLYPLHVQADPGRFAAFFEGRGYFRERLGIGTQAPDALLHVASSTDDVALKIEQWGARRGARIAINNASNSKPALEVIHLGTGNAIEVLGTISTDVLEIRGADLAEKFPVSEDVSPGMVVAIDPDRPGRLQISRTAYNHRVAGVVSGAGGLPAGAILGDLPESEDAPPVALSGRVWVYCDASDQPIAPGDLLTTAGTAGHAMKVVDRTRAGGAVLGKAMTSLDSGRGLVLTLLTLQ